MPHPVRLFGDVDNFPFGIEYLNDSISVGSLIDLADKVRLVERMVHVAKIGVEDDEVFQVWGCTEERQEYFSNFLSIPLKITQIHRLQCI